MLGLNIPKLMKHGKISTAHWANDITIFIYFNLLKIDPVHWQVTGDLTILVVTTGLTSKLTKH